MRIVAGAHRGRNIIAPKGGKTRPTTDRMRESIFNKLAHAPWAPELDGARIIDLFAGSGALGFEAISRGASFALFVETEACARGAIRQNIETMSLYGCTKLHRRSAVDLGQKPEKVGAPFDIALMDPPYAKGLGEQCVAKLTEGGWLADHAIIVVEESARVVFDCPAPWHVLDQIAAGETTVRFLGR